MTCTRVHLSTYGNIVSPFVRTGGVFHPFSTSRQGGSGFDLPRHGGSGFDSFSDDCGFYYYLPTQHGGSGFDTPCRGGAGFGNDLGDSIRFDGLLHDSAFDYSPTRHGHGAVLALTAIWTGVSTSMAVCLILASTTRPFSMDMVVPALLLLGMGMVAPASLLLGEVIQAWTPILVAVLASMASTTINGFGPQHIVAVEALIPLGAILALVGLVNLWIPFASLKTLKNYLPLLPVDPTLIFRREIRFYLAQPSELYRKEVPFVPTCFVFDLVLVLFSKSPSTTWGLSMRKAALISGKPMQKAG
jgi:amino acid transporter